MKMFVPIAESLRSLIIEANPTLTNDRIEKLIMKYIVVILDRQV